MIINHEIQHTTSVIIHGEKISPALFRIKIIAKTVGLPYDQQLTNDNILYKNMAENNNPFKY